MDSKYPVVSPVVRRDVGAAVLASTHMRRLLVSVLLASAALYAQGVLQARCDMSTATDYSDRHLTVLFKNTGTQTAGTSRIHSLNCTNWNNTHYVYTFNSTLDVEMEFYERDVFRCLREDQNGREIVQNKIYGLFGVMGLVLLATLVILAPKLSRDNRVNNHALTNIVTTIVLAVNLVAIGTSLLTVSNRLFFAYNAEGDERDLDEARGSLKFSAYWSAVAAGFYALGYFVYAAASILQFTGIKSSTVGKAVDVLAETTISAGSKPGSVARMRADTALAAYRHEFLEMVALFSVLAIVTFAARELHDDTPGDKLYQIVNGEGITGITFVNGSTDVALTPAFHSNTTCLFDRPFTMNVSMYDHILSTQHHLKNHMDGHGQGAIAVFIIITTLTLVETIASAYVYMKTTAKLNTAGGKTVLGSDFLAHYAPLVVQIISTHMLTIASTAFGLVVFYVFQQRTKHHLTMMDDVLWVSATFALVSVLAEFANTVIYVYHEMNKNVMG